MLWSQLSHITKTWVYKIVQRKPLIYFPEVRQTHWHGNKTRSQITEHIISVRASTSSFLPVLVIFLIDFYITEKTNSLLIVFRSWFFLLVKNTKIFIVLSYKERKYSKHQFWVVTPSKCLTNGFNSDIALRRDVATSCWNSCFAGTLMLTSTLLGSFCRRNWGRYRTESLNLKMKRCGRMARLPKRRTTSPFLHFPLTS